MNPQPYEIHFAIVRLNESGDQRPCVIIDPPQDNTVAVLLISGQLDSFNSAEHFLISANHPDFAATGLSKSCYVLSRVVDVPTSQLTKMKGALTGDLLKEFKRWFG